MAMSDHRDCPLAEVNRGLLVPFCGGLLMLFVAAAGSLGWATAVPLSAAVHAPGTIVVDSNRKIVQHQNGGVVAAIHVRDGSRLAAGDVLVELEDIELTIALKTVRPFLEVVLARRARLLAERAGQDTIDFPADFQAQASPSAQPAMSDQIRIFNARRAALKSRIASLENERGRVSRRTGSRPSSRTRTNACG
jgi:multidrug efflux pump subunit AcrA (membrane-fusion protein)